MTRSMVMTILSALLLALAGATGTAWSQAAGNRGADGSTAEAAADQDPQWLDLQQDFLVVYRTLRNARGLSQEERPAVERLLQRAEGYAQEHPDHAGAVAMQIQLRQWLSGGTMDDATMALFERLVELRPDDAALALKWMQLRLADLAPADPERLEMLRGLVERFPAEDAVAEQWVEALRNNMKYEEIIGFLENRDLDPESQPELAYALADAQFAAHRFADAVATLDSIPADALRTRAMLNRNVTQLKTDAADYVQLWEQEEDLRAQAAEADNDPIVEIDTSKGRVVVQLFEDYAPNTVANFISLAESGLYAGTTFHRFLPNFMVQGGDPNTKPGNEGRPGLGGPGYNIPDEHTPADDRPEPRKHFNDSISMAKTAEPNTAGSQFFLNHRPTPWLNGKHTVFGYVIEGRDVALSLRQDDRINAVRVIRKRDHAYEPRTIPRPDAAAPTTDTDGDDGSVLTDDANGQASGSDGGAGGEAEGEGDGGS